MNVLIIPSWYPSGADKLMGIYHKEYAEALGAREGINVDMLFVDRQMLSHPLKYVLMKKNLKIEENNYTVYIKRMLDVKKINANLQMRNYVKKMMRAFKEYLKVNPKPDIIQAMVSMPAGYAACKLGEKYNIPVVVTEHASYFKTFFEGKNKKYGDYVLKHATFTTVSEFMAQHVRSLGVSCEVIPNMVSVEKFKGKRKSVKGLRLIIVSAFRKGKRIDDAIEALKHIVEDKKIDARLTIVGDGLGNYYQNRCHELKMDDYVDFVGQKNKKEVAEILKSHNILVITSQMETFAIPGIEALASGIPVVATKCLGPEEYIDENCGKLVEVGDIEGLTKAILEVYQNIDKYDKDYLVSVANRYSQAKVIDKAISIYESLL